MGIPVGSSSSWVLLVCMGGRVVIKPSFSSLFSFLFGDIFI